MNNPFAPPTAKVGDVVQGFFYILPNLAIGALVFGLFVASWGVRRSISTVLQMRGRTDLGALLGGAAKWAILVFGFLVFAPIVFPSVKPGDLFSALGRGLRRDRLRVQGHSAELAFRLTDPVPAAVPQWRPDHPVNSKGLSRRSRPGRHCCEPMTASEW